jgi:hypothetical protein
MFSVLHQVMCHTCTRLGRNGGYCTSLLKLHSFYPYGKRRILWQHAFPFVSKTSTTSLYVLLLKNLFAALSQLMCTIIGQSVDRLFHTDWFWTILVNENTHIPLVSLQLFQVFHLVFFQPYTQFNVVIHHCSTAYWIDVYVCQIIWAMDLRTIYMCVWSVVRDVR